MKQSGTSHEPLDALWQAPAIIWMVVAGEAVAVALALAPGLGADRLRYFGLFSLATQWTLLLTLVGLYTLRRTARRLGPMRVAYLALALLLCSTWLVAQAVWFFFPDSRLLGEGRGTATLQVMGIALAVGILGLAAFHNHWRGRLHAVRAKQSELQALQARIRPHFLFNTLNTGAALVHQRPEEAERLLLDLADLFRAALAGPRQISLEDELSLARRYLEIEALRFGDRLQVSWHLPRTIPPATVPALSIQPLVENAIRHGVERTPSGDIEVNVTTTPDTVVVRISNTVPEPGGVAHTGHQVGLQASQVRIQALTGGRGSLRTELADGRYIATVRLPIDAGQATTR